MEFHKAKSKELRKTNFYIGKHSPEYKTAYGRAYDPPRACSAAVDSSLTSTATHFIFGTSKETSESEAKSRYKSSSRSNDRGYSGISRLETSKHHFDLGTDGSNFNTTASEFIKKHENFRPHDFRTYLDQNRKINFTFGSSSPGRVSITKSSYPAKNPSNVKVERDTIRDEHKKNHYYIGNKEVKYRTSHDEAFQDSFSECKPRYYSPNKYTLNLGGHKPSFKTLNSHLFTPKPLNDLTYSTKTIDDMLDCHFMLGADERDHKTIHQSVYSNTQVKDPSQILPETKMTSVKLGTSKNIWETSNKTNSSFYKVEKADYPYKGSFVVMGFDDMKGKTTTQDNYKRYAGNNQNRLDDFTSEDIKKRHFSFGSTSTKYQPVNRGYGSSTGPRQQVDEKFLNELKIAHYSFGNDEVSMMSTAKSEFTHKSSPVHVIKNDTRAHSIVLGTHSNNWLTMKSIDARKTIG
jgi:hypothetical protein